ncbi:hypothetical protein MCEMIH16_03164 [Caulobacteraceae bacterium]
MPIYRNGAHVVPIRLGHGDTIRLAACRKQTPIEASRVRLIAEGLSCFSRIQCHRDRAGAPPSSNGCDVCGLNRSARTALPGASSAKPPCPTTSCRSPRAAATTTPTSAASAPTATRHAPPSSSVIAGRSPPVRTAGPSAEPRGRVETRGPAGWKPRMVQTFHDRELATGGQDDLRPGLWRYRQAKENHDGLVEANDIRVVQPPHGRAQFGFGHGRNLVGHQPAGTA